MPRRPHDWYRQAEADFAAAKVLREASHYDTAAFSAHQAAEKAGKALHEAEGTEAWGHSVAVLLEGLDDVPDDVLDAAKALDKHYIPARYPNVHPAGAPADLYTAGDAEQAIEHAEKVISHVKGRLPQA